MLPDGFICLILFPLQIGPAAITAMVLVANLLSEDAGLITEVSCGTLVHLLFFLALLLLQCSSCYFLISCAPTDAVLTERLFALLPTAGDDPGARNALWSILNRICKCLRSTDVERLLTAQGLVRVLAEGSGSLVEDLDTHREEDLREEEQRALAGYDAAAITSRGVQAKMSTVSYLGCLDRFYPCSRFSVYDSRTRFCLFGNGDVPLT